MTGRFTSKDSWQGDYNRPLSLNRWNYTEGNPVNRTDPSGMKPYYPCPKKDKPNCLSKVTELRTEAQNIGSNVAAGTLLPVEGFAQFLDKTMLKFDNDIASTMWAATLVINGFDSSLSPISWQAYWNQVDNTYHIGQDWLPYNNSYCDSLKDHPELGNMWTCKRGDWKAEYWDKTPNQAYHGWFFAATTFFNGQSSGILADWQHEGTQYEPTPDDGPLLGDNQGNTTEDHALSMKMIELGFMLRIHQNIFIYSLTFPSDCYGVPPPEASLYKYVSPGNWIRANLKDQTVK